MESQLEIISKQLKKELATKEIANALLNTTFKGLSETAMRQAIFEGMMRGFTFKDFLEKNIYAIPFKDGYSLITSIDQIRKIAMRSGLAGKSEPKFIEENKQIVSCAITIKRNVNGVIGEYTATVFFSEYSTGRNLWTTKPHTMIAKVAEMHALRSAFPEEMAKSYIEEEFEKETEVLLPDTKIEEYKFKLENTESLAELKTVFSSMPIQAKESLKVLKDTLKLKLK